MVCTHRREELFVLATSPEPGSNGARTDGSWSACLEAVQPEVQASTWAHGHRRGTKLDVGRASHGLAAAFSVTAAPRRKGLVMRPSCLDCWNSRTIRPGFRHLAWVAYVLPSFRASGPTDPLYSAGFVATVESSATMVPHDPWMGVDS